MLRRIITTTLAHARQYSSSPRSPAMEQRIRTQLESALQPVHYELVNESHKHSVPRGSETHFKVLIVSDKFEGKSLLQQHQLVNAALKTELQQGLHALSITTLPTSKYTAQQIHDTPNCLGGSKHDK